jgi:hypothetical protein
VHVSRIGLVGNRLRCFKVKCLGEPFVSLNKAQSLLSSQGKDNICILRRKELDRPNFIHSLPTPMEFIDRKAQSLPRLTKIHRVSLTLTMAAIVVSIVSTRLFHDLRLLFASCFDLDIETMRMLTCARPAIAGGLIHSLWSRNCSP